MFSTTVNDHVPEETLNFWGARGICGNEIPFFCPLGLRNPSEYTIGLLKKPKMGRGAKC